MINNQKLSYTIFEDKIPISKKLNDFLIVNKLKKKNFISHGDDYQILFTANVDKSRIISNTSKKLGIKISKIGKITSNQNKSIIIDQKGRKLPLKNKGYKHQF